MRSAAQNRDGPCTNHDRPVKEPRPTAPLQGIAGISPARLGRLALLEQGAGAGEVGFLGGDLGLDPVNLRFEFAEAARDPDGITYHGVIRFRAVTEAN